MRSDKVPAGEPDSTQQYVSDPRFDTPTWRSVKKGTALGFAAGFTVAQYIVTTHTTETPIGTYYTGNVLLLFGACIGFSSALGAAAGWLNARGFSRDGKPAKKSRKRATDR